MFRLKNKLILYAIGAFFVLSTLGYTYYKGYASAKTKYQHAAIVAELKGVQEHAKITKQVMQLHSSDLDRALAKWMRDN